MGLFSFMLGVKSSVIFTGDDPQSFLQRSTAQSLSGLAGPGLVSVEFVIQPQYSQRPPNSRKEAEYLTHFSCQLGMLKNQTGHVRMKNT